MIGHAGVVGAIAILIVDMGLRRGFPAAFMAGAGAATADFIYALLAVLFRSYLQPVVVMLAGLQGSGKTTTTAKLARLLGQEQGKKVMVVSCDVYRPAAIKQLETLAGEVGSLDDVRAISADAAQLLDEHLDAGDRDPGQRVAARLGEVDVLDEGLQRRGLHAEPALGHGGADGLVLSGDVHHARSSLRVQVGGATGRH